MLGESPAVVVVNEDGVIVDTHTVGNQLRFVVVDAKAIDLTKQISATLKQIEFHMATLTENFIRPEETEDRR